MADNPIDITKIFNFSDTTPLDQVIAKTQQLNTVLEAMLQTAQKSAQGMTASMQAIQKSVESLEAEISQADSTTKKGQETIANGAATTAKAVAQNEEYKKNLADLTTTIKVLQEQIDKLSDSNKKLPKDNETQSGSLADLKNKLKEATDAYTKMGDSTDAAIKQKAVKNVTDLSVAVRNGQQVLNDAKRSVDVASGSYNELAQKVANATRQLKAMEGGVGSNSENFKRLQKEVSEGNAKLKEFDASIGNHQREVGNYGKALEGLAGQLGETGRVGVEVWKSIGEAAKSGWALVAAGVGVGIYAVKQFFERTEEGALDQEVLLTTLEYKWSKFKDTLAKAGKELVESATDFTRKFEHASELQEVQRLRDIQKQISESSKFTEKEKKDAIAFQQLAIDQLEAKMKAENDEQTNFVKLAYDREELMKREIEFNEETVKKQVESAKLLEGVYQNKAGDYAEQKQALIDLTKAIDLKKEADEAELAIAREKARINRAYTIQIKGTSTETLAELSKEDRALSEMEANQLKSLRRMETLKAGLLLKVSPSDDPFKLYEEDYQKLLDLIQKDNERLAKEQEETKKLLGLNGEDIFGKMPENDHAYEREKQRLKDIRDLKKEHAEKEKELAREVQTSIVMIVNDQYNAEETRIQNHLNRLSEAYQEEMAIAGTNTTAKIQLTNQYKAQEIKAQKELIAVKRKQAEFDRDAAAFTIVIKTAEQIVKDLGDPFKEIIDAAIGAAQLAVVLSKPLPSFYKGTTYSPEGLALVGERGPEIGIDRSGSISVYSEPQITHLNEGTKILTAEQSEPILKKMDSKHMDIMSHQLIDVGIRDLKSSQSVSREMIGEIKSLKEVTKKNKPAQVNYAKVGAVVYEFKREEETYIKRVKALSFGNWL
jgi:hypothetical protein